MIIGSIGVGLLILILVWIVALIIFVLGIKFQNNVAWIALGSAGVLTCILLLIPLEHQDDIIKEPDHLVKDYAFVYRVVLLSVIILSALVSFVFFFILHCIEPIRPRLIKQFSEN